MKKLYKIFLSGAAAMSLLPVMREALKEILNISYQMNK